MALNELVRNECGVVRHYGFNSSNHLRTTQSKEHLKVHSQGGGGMDSNGVAGTWSHGRFTVYYVHDCITCLS